MGSVSLTCLSLPCRYDCQSSIVDHVFPPLSGVQNQPSTQQEFSTFAFWREPIIDLRLSKAVEAVDVTSGEAAATSPEAGGPAMAAVVDAAVRKNRDEKAAAAAAKDSKIA